MSNEAENKHTTEKEQSALPDAPCCAISELAENVAKQLEYAARDIRLYASKVESINVQTRKEVEAEWSDIMALLHPHQLESESLYQTAKRVISLHNDKGDSR